MKRLLAMVLAVIMCVLPMTVNASYATLAGENSYTFSDAEGYAGDQITVDITLVANDSFDTVGLLGINYDEDSLELVKGVFNNDFRNCCIITKFDKTKMSVSAGINITSEDEGGMGGPLASYDGVIMTLTFNIRPDAPVGETYITVDEGSELKNKSSSIPHSINKGTVTVKGLDFPTITLSDKTVEYNGEEQTHPGISVLPEGASVKYEINGKDGRSARNAGEYTVSATVTAPGYNKWTGEADFIIEKKPVTVTATAANKEYDGTDKVLGYVGEILVDGVIQTDDIGIDPASISTIRFDSANVGTRTVLHDLVITGDDADNYEITYNVPTAKITEKSLTVTAKSYTVPKGGTLPSVLEYDVEGLVDGETKEEVFTGALKTSARNTTTVKNYDILVGTLKPNSNYKIGTFNKGILSVVNAFTQEITVTGIPTEITYGDEGFDIDFVYGENVANGKETMVSLGDTDVATLDGKHISINKAGTFDITVTREGDGELIADFNKVIPVTVAKKELTVTAKSYTVPKGGELPSVLEYDVEGLVDGDTKEDVFTGALKAGTTSTNTVKSYDILVGTLKPNDNYTIKTFNKGTLSVVNAYMQDITVTGIPEGITYGDYYEEGFDIDFVYGENVVDGKETVVSIGDTDVAVLDGLNIKIKKAGTFNITVTREGDGELIADYNKVIPVTVAKKPIEVKAIDTGKKVGKPDPELTYAVTGTLVGSDAFSGNVMREEGEEVGTYKIGPGNLDLTNHDSYEMDFDSGIFTIYDKTPQNIIVGAVSYTKTYGDGQFDLEITFGDTEVSAARAEYASDNEAVATVADGLVTVVGAGTAKITVTKAGDAELADFEKTFTVKVEKKAITVTADNKEKYVDQETPELTYTWAPELVPGDEFEGELAVTDKNVAGRKYDIKQGTLTLGNNYTLTFITGAKLEVLAKLDQSISVQELEDVTYGDTGLAVILTKGDYNADATPVFASSNEAVATVDANGNITIVGAGETTITVTNEGNYKYNVFEDEFVLEVAKADIKFVIENKTKRIGTDDPAFTYTTVGTLVGDDTVVEGDKPLTREEGEEIGTYDITADTLTLSAPQNYNVTYEKGTLTITEKDPQTLTVTGAPAEAVEYGAEGFTLTASTDAETQSPEFAFASSDEAVVTVDAEGKVAIVGAGTATITVSVAETDVYAKDEETVEVTVAPKAITLEAENLDLANKTATLTGVLEADKDFVSLDFDKLQVTEPEVTEPDVKYYLVSNLVLAGEKAGNYVLSTQEVAIEKDENAPLTLAVVTVVAENGTVEGAGSYLVGTNVTLKATANNNYKFGGWFAGEEKLADTAEYTFVIEADIELTAKFSKKGGGSIGGGGGGSATRTVYLVIGGEKVKVTVDKGDKVVMPEDPELEGHLFGGWYADAEFTTPFDFEAAVSDSLTLYAKFTPVEGEGEGEGEEGGETTEWKNPFTDVDEDDWYYEAVKFANENNLFKGVTETVFGYDTFLSRAMLVTVLYRAAGEPEVEDMSEFEDVSESAYYAKAVAWAAENEIVKGFDEDTFAPENLITREQFATIVFRYAIATGLEAVNLSENLDFEDADEISEYAVSAFNWAVGSEIIKGYEDGTIRAQNNTTRAEAATILYRFLGEKAE